MPVMIDLLEVAAIVFGKAFFYFFSMIVPFLVLEGVYRNISDYRKNKQKITIQDFISFVFKHIRYFVFCMLLF